MNENQSDGLWSATSMKRETSLYYCHDCDVAFCMGSSFEALHSYLKKSVSFHINGYYDCNYKHSLPT
jgi:hypothetical protein